MCTKYIRGLRFEERAYNGGSFEFVAFRGAPSRSRVCEIAFDDLEIDELSYNNDASRVKRVYVTRALAKAVENARKICESGRSCSLGSSNRGRGWKKRKTGDFTVYL